MSQTEHHLPCYYFVSSPLLCYLSQHWSPVPLLQCCGSSGQRLYVTEVVRGRWVKAIETVTERVPSHHSFFLYRNCSMLLVIKTETTTGEKKTQRAWNTFLHNASLRRSTDFVILPKGKEKILRGWWAQSLDNLDRVERKVADFHPQPFPVLSPV